jgi:hypothetical protein
MKHKTARKTKPAAPKRTSAPQRPDFASEMVTASAQALGLKLDPAWEANVTFNLQLILRHAALVDEFALSDDAEPAPTFHA